MVIRSDSKLLSKLTKIRHLDLRGNHFNKDAFRILGALPSLKFLSLENNRMERPLSNQGLTSFFHLEILDLSENNFFASIPPSMNAPSVAQNNLNGSLPIQVFASRLFNLFSIEENYELSSIIFTFFQELGGV
ncbi:hypothetical protein ACSBR1_043242 [Camellia fascicularis]